MDKYISVNDLRNITIDGIDIRDYPDLCDAFIESACWKSTGDILTEDELDRIDPEEVSELALLEASGG